jgi:hypothetical protein
LGDQPHLLENLFVRIFDHNISILEIKPSHVLLEPVLRVSDPNG